MVHRLENIDRRKKGIHIKLQCKGQEHSEITYRNIDE
jgi:hypothetical protein